MYFDAQMRSIRERLSVASGGPTTERGGSAERSQRGGSGAPSSSRNAAYSTDLAVKLQRIHAVLRPDIEEVKNRRRAQGRWSGTVSGAEYAAECGADKWVDLHSTGLPFNQLLDVKLLFEEKGGFGESEFLRCFAPVFCPTKDAASVKLWYLHMDQDANGSVGWDEFSEHLLMTHHADEAEAPLMYVPRAIEPESTPLAQSMVTRVVANEALGEYYTAHVDGGVRAWDAALLTEKATVHHGEGSLVHTLVYLPQGSRLVVGQYDRMVFIYHCFLKPVPCELGRKVSGYRLEKAFKGETLALNKPSFSRIMRTCEYDPESKIMENGGGEIAEQFVMHKGSAGVKKGAKVAKHYIDVVLMDDLEQGAHSMVPMYHTMQSDRVSDPFLMGLDNGVVQAYNLSGKTSHKAEQGAATHHHGGLLDAGSRIRSLARWTVHNGWVTHLLEASQLQGFISSSSDGTVQVFDVHKEESYIRMESDIGDGPGSGRGVTHFDYSTDKNLLCACGIARDAVVWNPKARQKMCKLGEHRAAICSVMFVDKYSQLLTLSEDKVLKIWDVRTFRCVQTLTDKTRRYPEDKYTAMTYDFSSDSVITCSSAPVAWREVNSHARIETGSAWHAQYEGHLTPVVACLYHERMGQLVTADQASVHVWDLSSGRRLGTWSPEGCTGGKVRLTALCFDSGSRRILVGCDSGDVSLYSLDGRRLKTFEMDGPPQEVSCLLHVTSHEGQGHAAAHAVAGGFGPRLAVWHDHPIPHSGHGVAVGRSPHYLQTQSLHIYSMAFCPPNKLAVGTAAGSCILYNLNNMSLLSVNLLAAAVPAAPAPAHGQPPPAATTTAGAVLKALAGGGGPATWKAASQQGREVEGRLQGTASFRHFRASMQARLLTVTEALCYVSPEVVVTLQGDGDAVVWRVFEGHFLKAAARFPAAFTAGDVAYALAYSPTDRLAYVGDCEAVVSVFDLSACCAAQPAGTRRRDSTQPGAAAANASAGPQHHNGCGVKLQTCFNLQITGVITELQVLKDSPALVVAANDCSVSVVNRFTGQVQVRLGSQRQHAASWPKGLPQELSTPRHPLSIASQRNETLSVLGKHRFAVVFPDDVCLQNDSHTHTYTRTHR